MITRCTEDAVCWIWQTMGNQIASGWFAGFPFDDPVRAIQTVFGFAYLT